MRKIQLAEGEFYHIFNRGVDKKIIFSEPDEYRRFIAYLHILNTASSLRPADLLDCYDEREVLSLGREDPIVALGAYCLMPNHFHLYATPLVENGISKYMQRVQTAYTMFYNQRHERSGVLLQGPFKAVHVNRDPYARYIVSYIHLNPSALLDPEWEDFDNEDFWRMREHIRTYPYSSVGEYISGKHVLVDPSVFPRYLTSKRDVDSHIDMWLQYRQEKELSSKKKGRRKHVKSSTRGL